jgi:hypothetical protein
MTGDAARALRLAPRHVANCGFATPEVRLQALAEVALNLNQYVVAGSMQPSDASDKVFEVAKANDLGIDPRSEEAGEVLRLAQLACEKPVVNSASPRNEEPAKDHDLHRPIHATPYVWRDPASVLSLTFESQLVANVIHSQHGKRLDCT